MAFYSDKEFLDQFKRDLSQEELEKGFKIFRQRLDEKGLRKHSEEIHDIHCTVFDDIVIRYKKGSTWDDAVWDMVNEYAYILGDPNTIPEMQANDC